MKGKEKKGQKKAEELSEEDRQLKEQIEYLVQKITAPGEDVAKYADQLFEAVRAKAGSRTTVPKELKFFKPLFEPLVAFFAAQPPGEPKKALADLLSYASIMLAENYQRDSLRYFEQGSGRHAPASLGDEYLLNLAGDVAAEYEARLGAAAPADELVALAERLLPDLFRRGHEISAVDLLIEVERLDLLAGFVDGDNYARVAVYLMSYLDYTSDAVEFETVLKTLFELAVGQRDAAGALRVALRQSDRARALRALQLAGGRAERLQLAFALARHRLFLGEEALAAAGVAADPQFALAMSNGLLKDFFALLLKDLDLLAAKKPADIYKKMLDEKDSKVDSNLLNLGDSFVNGFVNLGSGRDALLLAEAQPPWAGRVKEAALLSTVASLGLLFLWNFEEAQNAIAEYLDLADGYAKAGACVAVGLANSGVWNPSDPAKAILTDCLESADKLVKTGAAVGLGLAYAGSGRPDLDEPLMQLVNDESLGVDVCANAALALAMIHVAEYSGDSLESVLTSMTMFNSQSLDKPVARLFALALGVICLGAQDKADTTIEALKAIDNNLSAVAEVAVRACAFIASGNVLKLQEFVAMVKKHSEDEREVERQTMALLGVGCVAISEPVGTSMVLRLVVHLLQYAHPKLRRAVPILLLLVGVVSPSIQITDLLYKLAFEEDAELAMRAILALGATVAGSNNTRVSELLRNLAAYYSAETKFVYVVKIALGFVYAGKGVVTLNPFYSDRFLHSKAGFAGLLVLAFCLMNVEELLVGNFNYLLFYLGLAVTPKMLFFVDEQLQNLKATVRVGQAVDTVAQVGKPRRITGFQTFTSPVVVNSGERAELATEEFEPVATGPLEGFVILKKNPDFDDKKK